jgi:hypothetical protein
MKLPYSMGSMSPMTRSVSILMRAQGGRLAAQDVGRARQGQGETAS